MQGIAMRMAVLALVFAHINGSSRKIVVVVDCVFGRHSGQVFFKVFQQQRFVFI